VNGQDVSQARLEDGDVIELGGTELEVRVADDDAISTPTEPTLIRPPEPT
jgi:pSer/pThr/pTyr-binding forkhead associated (FHA) protein